MMFLSSPFSHITLVTFVSFFHTNTNAKITIAPINQKKLVTLRGGASEISTSKPLLSPSSSTKKKKKKKKKGSKTDPIEGKKAINKAMKKTDAATALGDAIRERSSILLSESSSLSPPTSDDEIDSELASLSFSLGSSSSHDYYKDASGGIAPSRSSILSNYLFQSHGGAYAFQSLCSLFAVLSGISTVVILPENSKYRGILVKRCLQSALAKHGTGMISASLLAAKRIPKDGLSRTRVKIEALAGRSPISQYFFYCLFLLTWMPRQNDDVLGKFYLKGRLLPGCLLGPVLLREMIHLAWVVCDAMVILGRDDSFMVKLGAKIVNAMMSLLFGANAWRSADSYGRQKFLARFVSRMSLVMEVLVGGIIIMDALRGLGDIILGGSGGAGTSKNGKTFSVLKRLVCARIYIHFLMLRRARIEDLLVRIRGGAKDVPIRVLDALLEPAKAMGLTAEDDSDATGRKEEKHLVGTILEALGL